MNTNIKKALIVDDEPDLCELAEITLTRMGLETQSVNDITSAKSLLASQDFDICLTDMNLPDGDGIDLVAFIQEQCPCTPVAVITAYGNMESAVRALKAGAFDFVSKPVDLQVLRELVTSAIRLPSPNSNAVPTTDNNSNLLGKSQSVEKLRKKITKLARSQAPVFIHGESGSGKELAAHLIHNLSSRARNPFIPVNCGAIPTELIESEFFGHKKGSFTGANIDKEGLFKAADGGTLFLDEVADLPLSMQVKLLRAIQEKAIRPIGDHQEHSIDVRILSASHKYLGELVKQGKFREDLYYRINVIELNVPSLRDRREDIPLLAEHLLQRMANKSSLENTASFTPEAMAALKQYNFPGNVRELENILERALAMTDDNLIQLDDLQLPSSKHKDLAALGTQENSDNLKLADQEKQTIIDALETTRWNKTAAAKLLGLSLRQLRYRLSKFNIE